MLLFFVSRKMTLVSQDLELFVGSLRYNIEYGLKGCTFEKVADTVKRAKADALISDLKHKYDTGANSLPCDLSSPGCSNANSQEMSW